MKRSAGFTLIELMVVIAIVAIIAAIAVPSFTEQLRKSRRSEAMATLSELQLRQERWRASNATYGTIAQVTGTTSALFSAVHDHYTYDISANTGTDVLITATPKGGHSGDRCGTYSLRIDNNNDTTPNGTLDKFTSTGASRCWQ